MFVETRLGRIKGVEGKGTTTFLGIPFAAPPIGNKRWQPPEKAAPWHGIFDATAYPNRSYQMPFPETLNSRINPGEMSEDMLYLNIYTPAADTQKRPVLVYIHGGGYTVGSANDFDPTPFARRHNAVVVSINYRLGLFGFLDLSRFGPEYLGSASLGFQDQIAALRWISENIADYGGDPANVTISGVSAGAGSVFALLAAPTATGLFHKAIAFSPGEIARTPPDLFGSLASALKMDDDALFAHLRSLSGKALFDLQTDNAVTGPASVDGMVIAKPADDAIRDGINAVPLIVGCCINEGTMLTPSVEEYGFSHIDEILAGLSVTIGRGEGKRYSEFLENLLPNATPRERMTRLWYDYFRAPTLRIASACAEIGNPVWVYSFEVPTDHEFGPTHASDMPFSYNLFESDDVAPGERVAFHRNEPTNQKLARQWTDTLAQFIRAADPNWTAFPHWEPYSSRNRATMALRDKPVLIEKYDSEDALTAYGIIGCASASAKTAG